LLVRMQILASALPGFRDLRAPLTAGYMWLLFIYLLVRPELGTRPTNEIGAAVFDLANEVGRLWLALAVGTAAYLVGAISDSVGAFLYTRLYATPAADYKRMHAEGLRPIDHRLRAYVDMVLRNPLVLRHVSGNEDPLRDDGLPGFMQRAPRAVREQFDRIRAGALEGYVDPESDGVESNFRTAIREIERELLSRAIRPCSRSSTDCGPRATSGSRSRYRWSGSPCSWPASHRCGGC
jgi:hypothetical protein